MPNKRPPNAEATQFRSGEEAVENGRKGGIASGQARRRRKALTDTISELFSMPIKDGKLSELEKIKSIASIKGKNVTVQEAIVLAQIQKALKGDSRSARLLIDIFENKATDDVLTATDNFLEALNGTAAEDWSDDSED